jgi:hypothetical protein
MGKTRLPSAILAISFLFLTGVATSALAMDVTLAWDANRETDLAGYKIYYGTVQGGPYDGSGSSDGGSPITVPLNDLSNLVSPEFTVHGLPDATYYFVVTAYNGEGFESGYSNEAAAQAPSAPPSNPSNSAPVLSNLQVNGRSGSTAIYTSDSGRQVDIRIVASDDTLVSQYLIADGNGDPNGKVFSAIPGGARQNPIFTVTDFVLNNTDGNHTVYAWVKDDKGAISATATKTNVILDRVAPTVAISYSATSPFKPGDTVTITAHFSDANSISGTPTISIDYVGTGSDLTGVAMTQVTNKQWKYAMTVPSANSGIAMVTVSALDVAGNAVGNQTGNSFAVDSSSPSVAGFPSINYGESSVTITFNESDMRNGSVAGNYSFNNGLLMSGNGSDISGINRIFKFPLSSATLQHYVIYTLQIGSAVTDQVGNAVMPDTIRVNDDDNDGMADDWEIRWFGGITAKNGSADTDGDGLTDGAEYNYARSNPAWGANRWSLSPTSRDSDGDGIPDRYEAVSGLNPSNSSDRDLDSDNDGWTNYEEYTNGTAANDPTSYPQTSASMEVVEAIPLNNAGIPPSQERIPNNAAFAVRMESINGIDITDSSAVTFSVNDGTNTYTRRLNDLNGTGSRILQATPLDADGNIAYSLWAAYYRSNETALSNSYPYGTTVEVTVSAKDRDGEALNPLTFRFRVQGQERDNQAKINAPKLSMAPDVASPSKKKSRVDSGSLQGAAITYDSNLMQEIGLEPYIGPPEEIPSLTTAEPVGVPLNLLPPAVFPGGVAITIPCPGYDDVSALSIYYFDGEKWVLASDSAGSVTPDGEGWMVSRSRINHNAAQGIPAYIEIHVYHFSAAVAADTSVTADTPATSAAVESGGGGGCFISVLGGK